MRYFAAVVLVLGCVADGATAANLLTNGSFEAPSAGNGSIVIYPSGSTAITGWTVTNSNIATIGSGVGGIIPDDGVQFLDLTGTLDGQGIYGGVSQTIATIDGQAYALSFALGNYSTNPGSTGVSVMAGSTTGSFTLARPASGFVWQTLSLGFVGSVGGSTVINFAGTDGFFYTGLDNVVVVAAGIPEPATWGMMIAGFGMVGVAARRRKTTVAA